MANMKFILNDYTYKGITLDESHYLSFIHNSSLDLGTSDFSIGIIFNSDSTVGNKGTPKILIHKGPYNLDNDTGYDLSYDATNEKLILSLNDGDAGESAASTANASLVDDTWHIVWINVDRNVGTTFYLNGSAISTASDATTGAQNTLNAAEGLMIGGFTGQNAYWKGSISSIFLCPGFLPSASWIQTWYYRMLYNFPRKPLYLYSTVWTFNESIDGLTYDNYNSTAIQTGTYESSGVPTYSYYYPLSLNLTLVDNMALEYERGFLPLDTLIRSYNGTFKYYKGATKQRLFCRFTSNSMQQRYFMEGIWSSRSPIEVYIDANQQMDFLGYMVSSPIMIEIVPNIWQYEIELEEI